MRTALALTLLVFVAFFAKTASAGPNPGAQRVPAPASIGGEERIEIGDFLFFYPDSSASLTINDITRRLGSFSDLPADHHFDTRDVWLWFNLKNLNNKTVTRVLELGRGGWGRVELHRNVQASNAILVDALGDDLPFDERDMANRRYSFTFEIPASSTVSFLLRLQAAKERGPLALSVYTPLAHTHKTIRDYIGFGLYYGVIFTIVVSILVFLLVVGDMRHNNMLLLFFSFLALFNFTVDGLAFQYFWPGLPGLNRMMRQALPLLTVFALLRFGLAFFEVKSLSRKGFQLGNAFLAILSLALVMVFVEALPRPAAALLSFALAAASTAYVLVACSVSEVADRLEKLLFGLGLAALLAGSSIFMFEMDFDSGTRHLTLKAGTGASVLLISVGFLNRVKKELSQSNEEAIRNLEELNRLKEETNARLEGLVQERTHQFKEINGQLVLANSEIQQKHNELVKAFKKASSQHVKLQKALGTIQKQKAELELSIRKSRYQRQEIKDAFDLINAQKQELELAYQAIQKTANSKELFLANTSHEIRTPLNAINGFVNLLIKSELSPKQRQYINNIKISSDNLLMLIDDILDFSKIEAGKFTFENIEYDFPKLINNIINSLKIKAAEKQVKIQFFRDPMTPDFVFGDPLRLSQIIVNLIGNAIKFTDSEGMVRLVINLVEEVEDKVRLEFNVIDSGIGISGEKLGDIFNDFTQAGIDINRKFGGTGLGLSIVKKLVENMGGTIAVESEVGVGSTFSFELEFRKGDGTHVQEPRNLQPANTSSLDELRVLLVEDNQINQTLAIDTIHSFNEKVEIDVAENGFEAIARIKGKDYDIVLMDIQMPKMDGMEATEIIRTKLEHPKCEVPILGLSAHAMKEEKEECLRIGMNDYMTKPFDPDRLFLSIEQLTGKNKMQQPERDFDLENPWQSEDLVHINLDSLNKMYKHNRPKIARILKLCLTQVPKQLVELKKFAKMEDWERVQTISHQLKTTLNYLGIRDLYSTAKHIEMLCKKKENLASIPSMVAKIDSTWLDAQIEIKRLVG